MEFKDYISVEDFQRLHKAVGWKIIDDEVVRKSLEGSDFVVSAVKDGRVVGMGRLVGDGVLHGLICDVIVEPEEQHNGIGKAIVRRLVEKVQAFVDNHDQYLIELLPTAGNADFYVKCGFKHDESKMEGCYIWLKNQNKYGKVSK